MENKYTNFLDFTVLTEYSGYNTPIVFEHDCGEVFVKTPNNLYEKRKTHSTLYCPKCHAYELQGALQKNNFIGCTTVTLYFIYFRHLDVYKVGITTRALKERLAGFKGINYSDIDILFEAKGNINK